MTASLRFIRPCSPIRATTLPAGDAWLHEPKLDGYRLQIVKSGRAVRLYSRNGHEWTDAPGDPGGRAGRAFLGDPR